MASTRRWPGHQPPEKLLHALRLQVFYTMRSERMLVEQLEYNLLLHRARRKLEEICGSAAVSASHSVLCRHANRFNGVS